MGKEPSSKVVDYETPSTSQHPKHPLTGFAAILGLGLILAFAVAGAGSDQARVSLPKKIALTAASVAIVSLILKVTRGRAGGCGTLAILYSVLISLEAVVMWFWN